MIPPFAAYRLRRLGHVVKNLTRDYPPRLMLHAPRTSMCPIGQSVMMAAEFVKHDVTHEFITLRYGEHGFGGADPAFVEQAHQAFVTNHLGVR